MDTRTLPFRVDIERPSEHHRAATDARFEIDLASEVTLEEVRGWATHPDESVVLHLIQRAESYTGATSLSGPNVLQIHREIVLALIERADQEGVVWTPTLEAAASRLAWRRDGLEGEGAPPVLKDLPLPEERMEQLVPWLSQAEPEDLRALVASEWRGAAQMVAEHAARLDYDLVRELAQVRIADDQKVRDHLDALARNPHVRGVALEWLVMEVVRRAEENRVAVAEALEALNERGATVSERVMEIAFLCHARAEKRASDRSYTPYLKPSARARRALLEFEHLTAEQVRTLTREGRVREDRDWAQIALHPATDAELFKEAAEHLRPSLSRVLDAAAGRDDLLADAGVRAILLEHGAALSLLDIASVFEGEEAERAAARVHEGATARNLEQWMREHPAESVHPRAKAILLCHPDQAVRLGAIRHFTLPERADRPRRAAGDTARGGRRR